MHVDYDDSAPFDDATFDYTHSAQATVELHTGGKSLPKQSHLFSISAWLGVYEPFPFKAPTGPLTVGALGEAGLDGALYRVLPDGEVIDATVSAPGTASYRFGVSQGKHIITLRANGKPLKEKEVTPDTTFCVGEKVVFVLHFDPPLANVKRDDATWTLGGTFVNAEVTSFTTFPSGIRHRKYRACHPNIKITPAGEPTPGEDCKYYYVYTPLLREDSTGAWWYDKGVNIAKCSMEIEFKNGQIVNVVKSGKFEIYRPVLSGFAPGPGPRSFMRITTASNPTYNGFFYGDEINNINGLKWSAVIDSDYNGTIAITQLLDAHYEEREWGGLWWQDIVNTDGFELDKTEPYWQNAYESHQPESSIYLMEDYPGIEFTTKSGVMVSGAFKDYLRFKPGPGWADANIFVTLGTVEWTCHGVWTKSAGIIINSTPAPGPLNDSTSFPFWKRIHK